jgi:uncharacterized membrane protein SpoIIM required for sporulation
MKETRFIEQKKDNWKELENLLEEKTPNPDRLSELFVEVTDDLSYARTYYGNRVVRVYLNQLTQFLFRKLFRNSVNHFKRFRQFVFDDLPVSVFKFRKQLFLALVIFLISSAIGVFTAIHDPEFSQSILGSGYVSITEQNIQSGDPMAIYKNEHFMNMFLRIATNNLLVAYRCFIFGLLFSVGSVWILVFNGIMVGVFQYFFIQKGIVWDSVLTIWMHGAMEIPAIIISGGAGLILGSGLVFPGTYTRMQALRISARSGIKIMAAITPIIIVAAFIETFLTRLTNYPYFLRAAFILLQLGFLVFYFVWLPYLKSKSKLKYNLREENMPVSAPIENELREMSPGGDVFSATFRLYFYSLPAIFKRLFLPFLTAAFLLVVYTIIIREKAMVSSSVLFFMKLYELIPLETNILNLLFLATGLNSIVFIAGNFWRSNSAFYPDWFSVKRTNNIESARRFLAGFIVALAGLSFLLIEGASGSWIFMIVFPPFMFLMSAIQVNDNLSVKNVRKIFDVFLQSPVFIAYTYFSLLFTAAMIMLLSDLSVFLSGIDFIHMLMSYSDEVFKWVEISILVVMLLAGLILSVLLLATGMLLVYFSALERIYAPGLTMQLKLLNLIKDETE